MMATGDAQSHPRRCGIEGRAQNIKWEMLSDLRWVIGAVLAAAMLAIVCLSLVAAVYVTHQGKVGPLELSRNLPFDDRSDWNQFYDPESAGRFAGFAHRADASEEAGEAADGSAEGAPAVAAAGSADDGATDAMQPATAAAGVDFRHRFPAAESPEPESPAPSDSAISEAAPSKPRARSAVAPVRKAAPPKSVARAPVHAAAASRARAHAPTRQSTLQPRATEPQSAPQGYAQQPYAQQPLGW
jgi:hypothetical protein